MACSTLNGTEWKNVCSVESNSRPDTVACRCNRTDDLHDKFSKCLEIKGVKLTLKDKNS